MTSGHSSLIFVQTYMHSNMAPHNGSSCGMLRTDEDVCSRRPTPCKHFSANQVSQQAIEFFAAGDLPGQPLTHTSQYTLAHSLGHLSGHKETYPPALWLACAGGHPSSLPMFSSLACKSIIGSLACLRMPLFAGGHPWHQLAHPSSLPMFGCLCCRLICQQFFCLPAHVSVGRWT